ncbi:hypothetical protein PG994_011759 [Apiospora phragmitis]|uniref:Protein kinase domain-containing protein n=1 Tax=Apiospora phragmitis TaxID=2905665 RepID=A0ABR1TWD4_9PEZI
MSTPTTATATIPPHHYRHHHTHHHAHYPPYPQLQSPVHPASYRTAGAIPSTLPANQLPPSPSGVPPPPPSTISNSTASSRHAPASTASYSTYISGPLQPSHRRSANGATASVASTGAPAARLTHEYHGTDSESASTPRSDANLDTMSIPSSSQNVARKRRRSKGPDWTEFYKNGVPSEVIVIDDTPEPDGDGKDIASNYSTTTYTNGTGIGSDAGVSVRHVAKKRKGRRNTTAPTSLGSLSSNGHYDFEASSATGQKRKRTRQQHAQEAKRRDIEALGDAYISYKPPQKPIKKSAEVAVRVITDVRPTTSRRFGSTLLTPKKRYSNVKVDDEDGHYIVVPDADITQQYQIIKLLGQGTFGKVVQARDRRRNKLVAIKIIRSVQKYRDASRIELRVLQTLKANDEENRNRCIHLRDCFDFRGHICIVMDLLGSSVFDFLKSNNFVPFPNSQIQSFARQLLTSVAFLHDLNLIHTDLKPENILLCDNAYQTFTYNRRIPSSSAGTPRQANQRKVLLDTEIRLIDFGSATFEDEYHSSVVSTRHYRAPKIILGLGWSFPCDIWSIGCILVEFFTGDALFQTHDNLEHLAMMENVCDRRIDQHLAQMVTKMSNRSSSSSGNAAAKYFKRLRLDYPTADTTRASRRFVKNMKRLSDIIPTHSPFLRMFLDLLEKIFVYDPAKRITARQALEHPWFKEAAIADDGTEAAKIRLERLRADPELISSSPSFVLGPMTATGQYAMDVPLRKLTDEEIDALTNLLSRRPNYGIAIPSQKWLSRQQEKVDGLPDILLEPKSRLLRQVKRLSFNARKVLGDLVRPLPERAILCPSHERLNPFLIRECFWLFCLEVGGHLECLRRWPHKSTVMASWLTRLDSTTAYFMSKEHFDRMFGCAPHDNRFVRVVSECEACILAAVGANGRCLADLFTALILRQDDYRAVDARRKFKPRLLRFVDSWIRQMKNEEEGTIRQWIEELLAEIRPGHLEIRSYWREYQKTEKRKKREHRNREKGNKDADSRSARNKRHSRHATAASKVKVDRASASEQRRLYREPEVAQSVYRDDSIANEANMAALKLTSSPANFDNATYDGGDSFGEREQGFGQPTPLPGDEEDEDGSNRYPAVGSSYDDSYEHEDEIANKLDQDPEDRGAGYSAHRSHRRVSEWYNQCLKVTGGGELDPEDVHPAIRQENSQAKSQAKSYFSVKSAVPQPLRKGKIPEEEKEEEYTPVRTGWANSGGAAPPPPKATKGTAPKDMPAANAPPVPRVPSRFGQGASSSVYVDDAATPRTSTAVPSTPGSPTLAATATSLDPDEYRPVSPLTSDEGSLTPTRGKFRNPWTQSEHNFGSSVDRPKAPPLRQPDNADDGSRQSARPPLFDRRELAYPDSEVTVMDGKHHGNDYNKSSTANKRYLAEARGSLKAVDLDKNPFIRQGSTRKRGGGAYQGSPIPMSADQQQRLDRDEQRKLRRDLSLSRRADPDLLAEDSASCVAPPSDAAAKSDITSWSQMMKKGACEAGGM